MGLVIVSGGQSGVDRAALEAAVASGVAYAGWCPLGGWAEDAHEPPGVRALYADLQETPARDPRQRTEWNVRDSDGVLALVDRRGLAISAGTRLALQWALDYGKPSLCLDLDDQTRLQRAETWLQTLSGRRLNVVGPRESEAPGICAMSRSFLMDLLASIANRQTLRHSDD